MAGGGRGGHWASQATSLEARSRKGAATRQRIILVAARLFAEVGIDHVAPHDILVASGQRNASAIQYHFGSHAGLVMAILQPRPDLRDPIDHARTQLLDDLAAGGAGLTLADAVRAWVLPLSTLFASPAGCDFIRVAAQVIRQLPLEDRVRPNQPTERRAHEAIMARLGHLPPEVAAERMGAAITLVAELYANRAREITHGLATHLPLDRFEAEVAALLTGLLEAEAGRPR